MARVEIERQKVQAEQRKVEERIAELEARLCAGVGFPQSTGTRAEWAAQSANHEWGVGQGSGSLSDFEMVESPEVVIRVGSSSKGGIVKTCSERPSKTPNDPK